MKARTTIRARRTVGGVAALVLLAAAVGCGGEAPQAKAGAKGPTKTPAPAVSVPVFDQDHSQPQPPELRGPLVTSDILVYSGRPLSEKMVKRIQEINGIYAVNLFSLASVPIQEKVYGVASVDPATFRRFTSAGKQDEIWSRLAAGEMVVSPAVKSLEDKDHFVTIGGDQDDPTVHVGAYAPPPFTIDMVINEAWGDDIYKIRDNALLISTNKRSPQSVRAPIEKIVGKGASIQMLDIASRIGLDPDTVQTAVPTGGSVGTAVGTYHYRVSGSQVIPDSGWVASNIRSQNMPIVGRVTCHKVMLPQLEAALRDLVQQGLSKYIHISSGCYNPRFIAGSTRLSNHAFGMAIDFDAPQNGRGTAGVIPPSVVKVFKNWGFAWGGDWTWTDPMHFELVRIVKVGTS